MNHKLAFPDSQYDDAQNDGHSEQEKAIGEIHEQEVTQAKTGAVDSGGAEGPIDARSGEMLVPTQFGVFFIYGPPKGGKGFYLGAESPQMLIRSGSGGKADNDPAGGAECYHDQESVLPFPMRNMVPVTHSFGELGG